MRWRAVLSVAAMGLAVMGVAQEAPLAGLPRHVAVSDKLHVGGQPTVETISQLRSAGISRVIDLRPDQETPDLDEKAVVEKAGLAYRSLPIAGAADLTRENVTRFSSLLEEAGDEGVLLHCASGNRVGAMLALRARWLEGKSAEESLAIGKAAGMTSLEKAVTDLLEKAADGAAPKAATP